jgi:putative addiction module component (TIGR02574 family)
MKLKQTVKTLNFEETNARTHGYPNTQNRHHTLAYRVEGQKCAGKDTALKEEGNTELSPAQQTELDKRLKKYERGEMKFKSWDETRASVRKRSKNAI